MQFIRLWKSGAVDRILAFDSLPEDLLGGIERIGTDGLSRYWKQYLTDKSDGKFYGLDYVRSNRDKEKWENISNYVRRVCDAKIRLMDKIENMAKPMAPNTKSGEIIEPEEVPVIPIEIEEKTDGNTRDSNVDSVASGASEKFPININAGVSVDSDVSVGKTATEDGEQVRTRRKRVPRIKTGV